MKRFFLKQLAVVLTFAMLIPIMGFSEGDINDVPEDEALEGSYIDADQQDADEYIVAIQEEQIPEELDDLDLPSEDELDVDDSIVYVAPLGEEGDEEVIADSDTVPEDPKADSDTTSDEQDNDIGNVTDKQDITSDEVPEEAVTSEGNTDATIVPSMDNDTKATPENEDEAESNGQSSSEPESEAGSESEMKKEDESASEIRTSSNAENGNDGSTSEKKEVESGEKNDSIENECSEEMEYFLDKLLLTDDNMLEEYYNTDINGSLNFEAGGYQTPTSFVIRKYAGTWYWPVGFDGNGNRLGNISSYVGRRSSPTASASSNHHGIDISQPRGSSVYAGRGGTLYYMKKIFGTSIGWNSSANKLGLGDNWLVIDHGDGFYTAYGHLSALESFIKNDSDGIVSVSEGQKVGQVGGGPDYPNEGVATGPHLHWEIAYDYNGAGHVDQYGYSMQGWGVNGWVIVDSAPGSGQDYSIHSGSGNSGNNTSGSNTTSINKTYRIKSTTTLGLNIRPSATTASTSLGLLYPGVTINCTKRTNYQSDGYYWLYGTTSTGITGWICENMGWIEEVQNTPASSITSTTSNSTTSTTTTSTSTTTKTTPTRTVTKSAKYKAKVGLLCQLLFKNGETAKSLKSSNTKVLTVSSTGLITVKAVGKAKIYIKTNKKKYTLTINTYDPTIPTKVSLSIPKTTIAVGGSITLTPVIPNGTNTTYTWKTSNKRVATVTNGTVKFNKKGKVTITCIANRGKKKAKVTFRVKK